MSNYKRLPPIATSCGHCGAVLPPKGRCDKRFCNPKCYDAAKYQTLVAAGLCTICGAQTPRRIRCKACDREHKLKRKYGITSKDYERLLAASGGVCYICGRPEGGKNKKLISVDHDHSTGRVRGLLCTRCNTGLGWFEQHGATAARYLEKAANSVV